MPVLTCVSELTAGMRLHQPVHHHGNLVLPAGAALNSADVDYLSKHCAGISVLVEDPVLDELVSFDDSGRDQEVAQETQTKLVELLADVQDTFASRLTIGAIDCRGVQSAISGVLHYLQQNPVMAMSLVQQPGKDQHYLVCHAAHVFYLSLIMGNAVRKKVSLARKKTPLPYGATKPPELNLTSLALAALFMDLGMWPIKDLFQQEAPLTEDQISQIRNHTIVSAMALPKDTDEIVRLVIETHHENFDGSGYPYGLCADQIHIFSRILRIADAFAAATSSRLYREAMSPVRALWEMSWGPFKRFYDPVLLKLFASLIQPYPIGAKLKLSTGQQAVVVKYGRVSPFLPVVVIAFDQQGRHLMRSQLVGPIKLEECPDLKIQSFQGEDLSDLYAHDVILDPITPSEFTTLFESVFAGCHAGNYRTATTR